MISDLHRARMIFNVLCEKIAATEQLEADDPFVLGTAEGECDLGKAIESVLREALLTRALLGGLLNRISELEFRKARMEAKIERLRAAAFAAMTEAQIRRIPASDFTAIIQHGRDKVILTEEDPEKIPDEFVKIERVVSKTKIREALNSGRTLNFAYISNADEILVVKPN